ncbi:hypothetical protein LP421_07610 [Rhizobium sp. RCAM05350]|nr:hypothetical protein LP421_07610 [Rhizobium sp. RCAM05350]
MMSPTSMPQVATKAARPLEHMTAGAALSSLITRVCAARVLREHHIWEAVRILPEIAGLPEDVKQLPEFRRLMEKEAFTAALRLLAQSCQPARDIRELDPHGDHWVATLSVRGTLSQPRRRKLIRAEHRDPPAALLIVLLGSAIRKARPFVRRKRANAGVQKEIGND